tara:strand:+ start:168 stop:458 length:291 start_codon:yes stop_codon:yes gene_type:complete
MVEGSLYFVKPNIFISANRLTGPDKKYRVVCGWRGPKKACKVQPPFLYLGWKTENWTYAQQHTNKIHYVMWEGSICVMDNQFAKHIVPLWDGASDG